MANTQHFDCCNTGSNPVGITNGKENKKIKKEEVISEGWYKGRKIKK